MARFGAHRLAQSPALIELATGTFTVFAQKYGSLFRALDFPNKGSSLLHAPALNFTPKAAPVLTTAFVNFFIPRAKVRNSG